MLQAGREHPLLGCGSCLAPFAAAVLHSQALLAKSEGDLSSTSVADGSLSQMKTSIITSLPCLLFRLFSPHCKAHFHGPGAPSSPC